MEATWMKPLRVNKGKSIERKQDADVEGGLREMLPLEEVQNEKSGIQKNHADALNREARRVVCEYILMPEA